MSWARIDDQYPDHPKIVAAGHAAMALDVAGICYCARFLTDGFIPEDQVPRLLTHPNPGELVGALLRVRRWETAAGGYLVHDYLDYNPTRAQALATRQARSAAGRRGGKQRARNLLDDRQPPATDSAQAHAYPVPVPVPQPGPGPGPGRSSTRETAGAPSGESRGGGLRAAEDGLLLLLLDALLADRGLHPTEAARKAGCDPDAPAVATACLAASLCDAGVERDVALDLAMTKPAAVATWLDHPEWWEKARNPGGLLVARIRAAQERRSA